jgi:hypothetical protein
MRAQNKKNGADDNQFGVRLGDIRKVAASSPSEPAKMTLSPSVHGPDPWPRRGDRPPKAISMCQGISTHSG